MARIEKTVFISYRRTDVYTALAVYENLKNQGYDVFFDYRSISSGDFEQIIASNIRARAHFLLILTATALDRCNEPGDWLRREVEIAINEKRNIVPLLFKGFRFGDPAVTEKLTGKLRNVSRYNGLNVHEDYFDEAMQRLRTQYLSIPLDTVLHPVSTGVQKVVREEKVAADKALEQIEDFKGLVKRTDEKTELEKLESQAIQYELKGDFWNALQAYYKIKRIDAAFPRVDVKITELEKEVLPKPIDTGVQKNRLPAAKPSLWHQLGFVAGGLLITILLIWSGSKFFGNLRAVPEPTGTLQTNVTFTSQPISTITFTPEQPITPLPTQTLIPPTPTLGIGSVKNSDKDGMILLYVPASEFTMGFDKGLSNEKPAHTVFLDAFWIDKTEVTNAMYASCVAARDCSPPISNKSSMRASYYSNSEFEHYPVIYVDWWAAKAYCEWAGRRLPTEAEWEKAARGTDGRSFPWGNDAPNDSLSNYDNAVGDTTEVGKYPNGASPYGVLDMAGNVWEWVSTLYRSYPYDVTDGREDLSSSDFRVLRGGAWTVNDEFIIRAAYRIDHDPSGNDFHIGFRCAVSATP